MLGWGIWEMTGLHGLQLAIDDHGQSARHKLAEDAQPRHNRKQAVVPRLVQIVERFGNLQFRDLGRISNTKSDPTEG